jgi:hypothetical protein
MRRVFENGLPTLVVVVVLIAYDHFFRGPAAPAPPPPDPAMLKLGQDYARALNEAAAATVEHTAGEAWTSTAGVVEANRKTFEQNLTKAWQPVAAEVTRRFGPVSDQPVAPATAVTLRRFLGDLARGIREGGAR